EGQDEKQHPVRHEALHDGGRAGSGQGDRGRHAEPHEHPAVDPAQERGGALGGQGPGGGEGGSRRHLKFVHGGTPPEVRILSGMKTKCGEGEFRSWRHPEQNTESPGTSRPDSPGHLTSTNKYGHMTNKYGQYLFALRRPDSDASTHRSFSSRRRLPPPVESPTLEADLRCPGSPGRAREGWPRGGSVRRANSSLSAQSALLCLDRASRLPRSPRRARDRAAKSGRQFAQKASTRGQTAVIDEDSSLDEGAAEVSTFLDRAGIRAVLTGGAAAVIHTGGDYQSEDLDFILQSSPTQKQLDEVLSEIGFVRKRDHYVHPRTRFFIE